MEGFKKQQTEPKTEIKQCHMFHKNVCFFQYLNMYGCIVIDLLGLVDAFHSWTLIGCVLAAGAGLGKSILGLK